ncbi:8986_t:CDS:2, partial [Rhizophagus irregularis]
PYVFGLQLEILQQARNAKRHAATLKPFDNLTLTGQNNRAKKIAKSVHAIFDQTAIKSCHLEDKPILKSIEFDIKDQPFHINMGEENVEDMKHKVRATVQACDRGQIARDGYRTLALFDLKEDRVLEEDLALEEDRILEEDLVLEEDQDHLDLMVVGMIKQMFSDAVKNI